MVPRLVMIVSFAAACGSQATESTSSRFVGPWLVEETMPHATYGASSYELQSDGSLTLIWDAGILGIPQGHVRNSDRSITCVFGDAWTSSDAVLLIDGKCSDDLARTIELELTSPASSNASGATVEIKSVAGEDGWQPPQWGWSLRKCADVQSCRTPGF